MAVRVVNDWLFSNVKKYWWTSQYPMQEEETKSGDVGHDSSTLCPILLAENWCIAWLARVGIWIQVRADVWSRE